MADPGAMDEDYISRELRERDRDRYLADLFIPAEVRPHLHALHAFNAEIVRIPEMVSDPVLGEIRQEWWRGVLRGSGEGEGHPVAAALLRTVNGFRLPTASLVSLVEARTFDLYNDPMPDVATFEAYAGETSSVLFQIAALILNGGADPGFADAAGHAGVAATLAERLRRLAVDARRGQLFLPRDRFAQHGVTPDIVFAGRSTPGIVAAAAGLREMARNHLAKAQAGVAGLPPSVRPAFLPLALIAADLARLEKGGSDPMAPLPDVSQWRRQWTLWRAARAA